MRGGFQTALALLYPPRCLSCGAMVDSDFGLCGPCWRETPFIGGPVCDACGVPLPGPKAAAGERLECDSCMARPRPWTAGRAALLYDGKAREMVLALKHSDRQEIARPAGLWMARAVRPLLAGDELIAPVPLHWLRLLQRRYNQAALLAAALGAETRLPVCPDLLRRPRRTAPLDKDGVVDRFARLSGVIEVHPRRRTAMAGRSILLVDDVMTSGATLTAAAEACLSGGAAQVRIVTLARVQKG